MFEGAGEPGIFSVPEPRGMIKIFPSLRAYMVGRDRNLPSPGAYIERERSELFQVPKRRQKFGIFPSPGVYMKETVR